MKPERHRIRGRQGFEDELDEQAGPDADVLEGIINRADFDEAHGLLNELRADIKRATRHRDRLNLVKDFVTSCDPGWLRGRRSEEIAALLGATVGLVQRARGFGCDDDSESCPETAPESPIADDLSQVEDQVKIEPAAAPVAPAPAPLTASVPAQHRQRFGLRLRSRRWLAASLLLR